MDILNSLSCHNSYKALQILQENESIHRDVLVLLLYRIDMFKTTASTLQIYLNQSINFLSAEKPDRNSPLNPVLINDGALLKDLLANWDTFVQEEAKVCNIPGVNEAVSNTEITGIRKLSDWNMSAALVIQTIENFRTNLEFMHITGQKNDKDIRQATGTLAYLYKSLEEDKSLADYQTNTDHSN